jgi:hypothetical protein
MKKTLLSLTDQQMAQLRKYKEITGLTLSDLFRRALDKAYPADKEPKGKYNARK